MFISVQNTKMTKRRNIYSISYNPDHRTLKNQRREQYVYLCA